jgi:outer membrane protein assembly factor BamB
MKNHLAPVLIPCVLAGTGIALLLWWTGTELIKPLQARVPGNDGAPAAVAKVVLDVPLPGEPTQFDGKPSTIAASWPWFRGENLDAICSDSVPLARKWSSDGPKHLWSVELGEGFASAAVKDGRVFILDYDKEALADTMRCFSLDDGAEIWRNSYPVEIVYNHGMSRTVAAVHDGRVISLGPKCHVTCWDTTTGKAHWLLDLVRDFGAKVPTWYAGQCALIDKGRLILAPGGKALLMAVDITTGEVLWESANPEKWDMTHVSVVPMEFGGKRIYVYCGSGGVAGVSAEDGEILWQTTAWKIKMAACPTPVVLPDGKIFCCGGYNAGSLMLQLTAEENDKITVKTLFKLKAKQFSSVQQTPVLYKGHLFGVRQKGKQLVCLDFNGKEVWKSGKDKFGSGPYMIADGLIYVMDDDGMLTMAEATAAGYKPLAKAQVIPEGYDSWGPMALVAGRLIVRDMTRMVCVDVSEEGNKD